MAKLPNILLILADDHGYGDISVHNGPSIQTRTLTESLRKGRVLPNFMQTPLSARQAVQPL